jgi:hypothetical protein
MCELAIWPILAFAVYAAAIFMGTELWYRSMDLRPRRHYQKKPILTRTSACWIFGIAFTTAVAFLGIIQVFPWWGNASMYVVAFVVMVACGLFCDLNWTRNTIILATVFGSLYVAIFGFAIYRQYVREYPIKLVFQESQLLSPWRKMVITHDLRRMARYLHDLGVPVPENVPTIGVERGNSNCTTTSNAVPVFRSMFKLGTDCISNRRIMTGLYLSYVIESMPSPRSLTLDTHDQKSIAKVINVFFLLRAFESYFQWSFWGDKSDTMCDMSWTGNRGGASLMWKIRSALGKDFTDELMVYSLLAANNDPFERYDDDDAIYLGRKLKIGDDVIDDGTKWPTILSILRESGIPVEKL